MPADLDRLRVQLGDAETISELLDNPTIVVTEEQLKAEYGFVTADLEIDLTITTTSQATLGAGTDWME